MTLPSTPRLILTCFFLVTMLCGACTTRTTQHMVALKRAAPLRQIPVQDSQEDRIATTRDVLRLSGANTTAYVLDTHQHPSAWKAPLTLERAAITALTFDAELHQELASLGIPLDALHPASLQSRLDATALSAMVHPLPQNPQEAMVAGGTSQHPWPKTIAEAFVAALVWDAGSDSVTARSQPEQSRLVLAATAAVLDVIQEVRERWYQLVAASQLHVAAMDELLSSEAAWGIAQRQHEEGEISEKDLLTSQARYEMAHLAATRWQAMLHDAKERMHETMGGHGAIRDWNIQALLPMRPMREVALEFFEPQAVKASLELAMARQQGLLASQALWGGGEAPLGQTAPLAESFLPSSERFWNAPEQQGLTQHSDAGVPPAGPSSAATSTNWAFPAPFFASPGQGRTSLRAAMDRDWRRYNAMAAVVRKSARGVHAALLRTRETLESVEAATFKALGDMPQGMAFVVPGEQPLPSTEGEHQAFTQRKVLIQAQLEYWMARSKVEHLLAGRMVEIPAIAFSQVSIMESPRTIH